MESACTKLRVEPLSDFHFNCARLTKAFQAQMASRMTSTPYSANGEGEFGAKWHELDYNHILSHFQVCALIRCFPEGIPEYKKSTNVSNYILIFIRVTSFSASNGAVATRCRQATAHPRTQRSQKCAWSIGLADLFQQYSKSDELNVTCGDGVCLLCPGLRMSIQIVHC